MVFLFQSCKKTDIVNDTGKNATVSLQANDFFSISENAPAAEKVIIKEMQKQLKEADVQDFLNWHGQPLWKKIIKFEKDKNGTVTYAIPTQKNGAITGFFAATISKLNSISFEMHRQTAVALKKGEYSYVNINTQKSKTLFDFFNGKSESVNESAASENTSSAWSCYWLWVEVTTLQATNGNQQNMEDPGGYWELRCIYQGGGGGGTGGGDPGGGGTGGGGTGGCGGGGNTEVFNYNGWNNEASLLSPCELIEVINRLSPILNLTALQIHYLMERPGRTEEIDRYLTSNPQNVQIAKDHLNRLTQDIDYDNFVEAHAQTGDPMKMWWEDNTWLAPYGGINFGSWAIDYLSQNPTVSFAFFQNQYMVVDVFSNPAAPSYPDISENEPPVNLQSLFNCFNNIPNAGATYSVKLCADLPVNGVWNAPFNLTGLSPGHTFLTLTKTNGNQSISQSVGFYPIGSGGNPMNPTETGRFKNNGLPAHEYNAAVTANGISAAQFMAVINNLLAHEHDTYNIFTNNCTTLALNAFNPLINPPIAIAPFIVATPTSPPAVFAFMQSPQKLYKSIESITPGANITKEFNVVNNSPTSTQICP